MDIQEKGIGEQTILQSIEVVTSVLNVRNLRRTTGFLPHLKMWVSALRFYEKDIVSDWIMDIADRVQLQV